jgi:hypothetical protein
MPAPKPASTRSEKNLIFNAVASKTPSKLIIETIGWYFGTDKVDLGCRQPNRQQPRAGHIINMRECSYWYGQGLFQPMAQTSARREIGNRK